MSLRLRLLSSRKLNTRERNAPFVTRQEQTTRINARTKDKSMSTESAVDAPKKAKLTTRSVRSIQGTDLQ